MFLHLWGKPVSRQELNVRYSTSFPQGVELLCKHTNFMIDKIAIVDNGQVIKFYWQLYLARLALEELNCLGKCSDNCIQKITFYSEKK